jgi:CDP-diacylglycerol--glycerol-3-phosphate 3-phosphatidyltransferase
MNSHSTSGYRNAGRTVLGWLLSPAVDWLAAIGVRANEVTLVSLFAGLLVGVALAFDQFGWATGAIVFASLGDAVDGMLARRTGSASVGGALLDAAVDRYGEFFVLAGLAVLLREDTPMLVLALLALAGSFMVSYGSAKAEALRVAVPDGRMRRAERATVLSVGVAFVPFSGALATRLDVASPWVHRGPILIAVAVVAAAANVSAVRRLRLVALAAASARAAKPIPGSDNQRPVSASQ